MWKIGELLRKRDGADGPSWYKSEFDSNQVDGRRLGLGMANQFQVLGSREGAEC